MSPAFDFFVKIDETYVTSRNFREMSGTLPTKIKFGLVNKGYVKNIGDKCFRT